MGMTVFARTNSKAWRLRDGACLGLFLASLGASATLCAQDTQAKPDAPTAAAPRAEQPEQPSGTEETEDAPLREATATTASAPETAPVGETSVTVSQPGTQLAVSPETAQEDPAGTPTAGEYTHDGFFLRFNVGFGYTSAFFRSDFGERGSVDGGAFNFAFALGGAVVENLIVYGETFFSTALGPTFRSGGETVATRDDDVSLTIIGIGPGVSYYIMPNNLYISTTIGVGRAVLEVLNDTASSNIGFLQRITLGKEWWTGKQWGLGLNGELMWGYLPDEGGALYPLSVAVNFSATFN